MRVQAVRVAALLTTALVFPLVAAEEVVEFQDGRYLQVHSHEVIADALRLNVSENSFLILPLSNVDRIERGGKDVFRRNEPVVETIARSEERALLVSNLRVGPGKRVWSDSSSGSAQTARSR